MDPLQARDIHLVRDRLSLRPGRFPEAGAIARHCARTAAPPMLVCMATFRARRRAGGTVAASLAAARIRFMGTDGLRGRTAAGPAGGRPGRWLELFQRRGLITPGLVRLVGRAFARQVRGGAIVAGEDGRDRGMGGGLYAALLRGLAEGGLTVHDAGVIPTPAIPVLMARWGVRAGVVLTASHNPANQNGVKFFMDGRKLLPDGPAGDYALSARMYRLGRAPGAGTAAAPAGAVRDVARPARAVFIDAMVRPLDRRVRVPVIVDAANGAFSRLVRPVLARTVRPGCGRVINAAPRGANINRGCGAATVEGTAAYAGNVPAAVFAAYPSPVRALFGTGRRGGARLLITVDGDGDRGFLLVYRPGPDRVEVLDGDRCGYALACLRRGRAGGRRLFAGTVESDIRLFGQVDRVLGLDTAITCVGDKWLAAGGRAARLLVGAEVSGHILLPLPVAGPGGRTRTVLAGNGLQAMLMLAAACGSRIPAYPAGFTRTLYTYNVDRTRFTRGSPAWAADLALIRRAFHRAAAAGAFGPGLRFRVVRRPEEDDLLYAGMFDRRGVPAAAVFVRSSGTEHKIGTYLRGAPAHAAFLNAVGAAVAGAHRGLKDARRPMGRAEQAVLTALARGRAPDRAAIRRRFGLSAADWDALLYGLRREGRLP